MNNFDKVKKLVLDTKIENDNSIAYLISDLSYYDYYEEQLKALEKIEDKLKQNITLHNVLCMLEDYKEELK